VSSRLTRGAFLALAAAGVGAVAAGRWLQGGSREPELAFTTQVAELFDDRGATREIGRAYLRDHPEEEGERELARLMNQAHPGLVRGDLRRRARAAVRTDYRRGDVLAVDGWYLSRTEARLAALVTFA
jgi:hypothetical protein